MLSLVSVKRIVSDVPTSNFDRNELEIAGELSLALGGFVIPPVVRDSHGYKTISGHFQYHAAVVARRLNPKAGETIPAIVLESKNQTTAERTTQDAKVRRKDAVWPHSSPRMGLLKIFEYDITRLM
jgi:hypothetical protein